jgi:hypothetical protein
MCREEIMKQQHCMIAIELVLILIFLNVTLNAQGLDVVVHFPNDYIRSGELVSVGDSSVAVLWSQRKQSTKPEDLPVAHIQAISFTHTIPGDASALTKAAGSAAGIVVGGAIGFLIGDAIFPPSQGFIQIHYGAGFFSLVGAAAGYGLGPEIVNPSTHLDIRLDPNISQHRDSLRVYLRPQ